MVSGRPARAKNQRLFLSRARRPLTIGLPSPLRARFVAPSVKLSYHCFRHLSGAVPKTGGKSLRRSARPDILAVGSP